MDKNVIIMKSYLLIICAKFIYSIAGIFSKLASGEEFLSYKFCIYYLIVILILGIYAILWQQVLKNMDLSTAMLFKPLALVLSIMWATLLFKETVSIKMIVGIVIIVVGIIIAGLKDEK